MCEEKKKRGTVFLVSLGCPKNRVDSEMMLGSLTRSGYDIVADAADADVLVVNTCAFIGPAKEESIDSILELARVKNSVGGKKLVVTGCLTERYGDELASELPEVDHFLGTAAFAEIGGVLNRTGSPDPNEHLLGAGGTVPLVEAPRVRTTGGGWAYLKISEGCDNACSFCVIPSIRGPQRSRPVAELIREAEGLVHGGAKELNLIAQDLTAYGRDLPGRPRLADLLGELSGVDGLRWIRMLYAYPRPMPMRFYELWAEHDKILPYLDIPLQHASERLLGLMKRGSTRKVFEAELEKMRQVVGSKKELTLRTTLLVGHPGETAEDFEELVSFVRDVRFERLGVFIYSDEEGTSAFSQPHKVDTGLAEERRARLMELQQEISAEHQRRLLGRKIEVLVEGPSEESDLVIQGRHRGQAPEIDGVVYIEGGIPAPGEIVEVEVTATYEYDLVGALVGSTDDG